MWVKHSLVGERFQSRILNPQSLNDQDLRNRPPSPPCSGGNWIYSPQGCYALVTSFLTKEDLTEVAVVGESSSQVCAMSCSRRRPCQIVFTPGSPSPLRAKKPPSWAIQRTQVFKLGGDRGGCGVL